MPLLKGGEIIADDWRRVGDDEAIDDGNGAIIVPFARLAADFDVLKASGRPLGVEFPNDGQADELADYIGALDLVALAFPAFTDGRAYSLGRQIRARLEFAGELRATGDVLPDQLAFMRQCGFDAFEIGDRFDDEVWHRAVTAMSLSYQNGYAPDRGFAPANILQRRMEANNDRS